ncbi:MAG: hypothetical protein IH591_00655 [Bacteroidales bacterium]|nr:hypothetical protein [Bacteroidales bacterium]
MENSIGVLKIIAEYISPNLHISLMSQYYPPHRIANRKFETASQEQDQSRTRTCPDEVGSVGTQIVNLSLRLRRSPAHEVSGSRINPVHAPVPMKSGVSGRKSLNRTITRREYETVLAAFHSLGFTRGWLQENDSHIICRPDFSNDHPFEWK